MQAPDVTEGHTKRLQCIMNTSFYLYPAVNDSIYNYYKLYRRYISAVSLMCLVDSTKAQVGFFQTSLTVRSF